jgi:hypothetical protein
LSSPTPIHIVSLIFYFGSVTVQDGEDASVAALPYTGLVDPYPRSSSITQSTESSSVPTNTAIRTSSELTPVASLSVTRTANTTDTNANGANVGDGTHGHTSISNITQNATLYDGGDNISGSLKAGIIALVVISVFLLFLVMAFIPRYYRRRKALRRFQRNRIDLLQSPKPIDKMHSLEVIHLDIRTDMYEDLPTGALIDKYNHLEGLDRYNATLPPGLHDSNSRKPTTNSLELDTGAPFSNYNRNRYTVDGWTVDGWTHDSATVMTSSPVSPSGSVRDSIHRKPVNYSTGSSTHVP